MRRTLLYSFITAILLVPLLGVQAMAQETYVLPENNGTLTMKDIIRDNPSLKGIVIYGDIQRDGNGNPVTPVTICGGIDRGGKSMLNNADKYGTENPDITFKKDDIEGLTLISNTGKPIERAILYIAEYKDKDWWKSTTSIILERQNSATDQIFTSEKAGDTTKVVVPPVVPETNAKPYPWWTWLLCGFLSGFVLSFIIKWNYFKKEGSKDKDEGNNQCYSSNSSQIQQVPAKNGLSRIEVEQIVDQIVARYSSELLDKVFKKIDSKLVNLGSERSGQNNTIQNVSALTRSVVREKTKVHREDAEVFCGYAALPQNGDDYLTIIPNPERAAFVIHKKGSEYFVGLSEDEQILSQLVHPAIDFKKNGSKIFDFPDGELQNAQKVVCKERGIFRKESEDRIAAVKPILIRRG